MFRLNDRLALVWISLMPWISAGELAEILGVDPGTISRRLSDWIADGLVIYRETGHLKQRSRRLLLTNKGLLLVHPERHSHRGESAHRHFELGTYIDSINGHSHPGFFTTKRGAEQLYCRLEMLEVFYTLAPVLFEGRGLAWTPLYRPPVLISWRWISSARFIEAVADYSDGTRVYFVWVGRSMTMRMIQQRWANPFESTDKGNPLIVDAAPGETHPIMSGLVVGCSEERGAEMAKRAISAGLGGRQIACCYAVGVKESQRVYTGVVTPPVGNIAEWLDFENLRKLNDAGAPEELAGDAPGDRIPAAMRVVDLMSGVPLARTADLIADYPGFTHSNLTAISGLSSGRVTKNLDILTGSGLVTAMPAGYANGVPVSVDHYAGDAEISRPFDMYYPADSLLQYAARRDNVSLKSIRARAAEDLHGDHKPGGSKIQHTLDYNRCMVALDRGGYHTGAGFRDYVYLPGGKQLAPDARMRVTADFGECHVLNLSVAASDANEAADRVTGILKEYSHTADSRSGKPLVCVCQETELVNFIREEALAFEFPVWVLPPNMVEAGEPRGAVSSIRPVRVDLDLLIEYERTARTPAQVTRKYGIFVNAATSGHPVSPLFICETEEAMKAFRAEHENSRQARRVWFPMVSATLDEILKGKKSGDLWVVDWMDVPLYHAGLDRQLDAL